MEREGIVVAVVAVVVVVVVVVASVAEIAWRDGESQSWGTHLDFGGEACDLELFGPKRWSSFPFPLFRF